MKQIARFTWGVVAAAGFIWATAGAAEEQTGAVVIVGSGLATATHLDADKLHHGPKLCDGEVAARIRRIAGITVRASGLWQLGKNGQRECFAVRDFTILRMPSGREAVVGVLAQDGNSFILTDLSGQTQFLTDVPRPLKKMLGQMIIMDLRQMANPAVKKAHKVVVSYRPYP